MIECISHETEANNDIKIRYKLGSSCSSVSNTKRLNKPSHFKVSSKSFWKQTLF